MAFEKQDVDKARELCGCQACDPIVGLNGTQMPLGCRFAPILNAITRIDQQRRPGREAMTRLCIAAASAEIERAEAFRDACKAMGYVVDHDWMAMVRSVGQANGAIGDDARRAAKRLAYAGASTCDVFVLLLPGLAEPDPRWGMASRLYTIGAWWELGVASYAHDWTEAAREILIVGDSPDRTVMTVDLPHVWTDAEALEWLRGRLAGG